MSPDPDTTAPAGAGRREWLGLAVLALPTLVLAFDMSMLYLAAPMISTDLLPSSSEQLWIIDIYGFMIAGFLITMGTLGDRIGRRRLLLFGAAAFAAASVLAAFAPSAPVLILSRALLGIAGATLMPSTLALISNMFADAGQRTVAISIWLACFMAGMAIGPVVGGVLLSVFWWGAVFLLAVPVMVLLLALGPVLLPEFRAEHAGRLDITSVALSLAAMLPIVYGIKQFAADGAVLTSTLTVVVGIGFAVVFARRQLTLTDPLLDLALFRDRAFSAALLTILIGTGAAAGIYLLVTQYLQVIEQLTPLTAGLWLIPTGVASVVGAIVAPPLAGRFAPGIVIAGGLAVAVIGYVLIAITTIDSSVALPVVGVSLTFFGVGPMAALGTDLIVGSAPPARAGSAASMSETSTELGIALGVALLGSLAGAIYRTELVLPPGLNADTTDVARDTAAGAAAAASGLTDPAVLLGPARAAYGSGMTIAAITGAVIVAVLAAVSALALRRVVATAHHGDEPTSEPSGPAPDGDRAEPGRTEHGRTEPGTAASVAATTQTSETDHR